MRVKSVLAGEGGGARPPPLITFTLNSEVAVYAPAEWALGRYTDPVSSLPIYVLCGCELWCAEHYNQKPNSWTYNFVEVSGHNLESSQTWGFCMNVLGRGYGFSSGCSPFFFTVYSNWSVETVRGCVSLKKYKSQGKAVEVAMNRKEETFKTFVLISCKNLASGKHIFLAEPCHMCCRVIYKWFIERNFIRGIFLVVSWTNRLIFFSGDLNVNYAGVQCILFLYVKWRRRVILI